MTVERWHIWYAYFAGSAVYHKVIYKRLEPYVACRPGERVKQLLDKRGVVGLRPCKRCFPKGDRA